MRAQLPPGHMRSFVLVVVTVFFAGSFDASAQALTASTQHFHGIDLSRAPRTTDASKLPDLWEERPKGSRSFEIRKEVKFVYRGLDGTVYYVPEKKCFYIQSDAAGSSTMTFFGPFQGDPAKMMKLEPAPSRTTLSSSTPPGK